MKHSIRFAKTLDDLFNIDIGESSVKTSPFRHSYVDWFLIPTERFMIPPPEVNQISISIPASNGALDLTEALTGAPTFKPIEGEMSFWISNDKIQEDFLNRMLPGQNRHLEVFWVELYRDICAFLHGKELYMMLEDDPQWIYKGRFSAGKYDASDNTWSQIKISYVLYPFKRLPWRNDNEWYLDSLNLNVPRYIDEQMTGIYYLDIKDLMNKNINIEIDDHSNNGVQIANMRCGEEPVVPVIHVEELENDHMQIRVVNHDLQSDTGWLTMTPKDGTSTTFDYYNRQIVFSNYHHNHYSGYEQQGFTVSVKGKGIVSFYYDIGVI